MFWSEMMECGRCSQASHIHSGAGLPVRSVSVRARWMPLIFLLMLLSILCSELLPYSEKDWVGEFVPALLSLFIEIKASAVVLV